MDGADDMWDVSRPSPACQWCKHDGEVRPADVALMVGHLTLRLCWEHVARLRAVLEEVDDGEVA